MIAMIIMIGGSLLTVQAEEASSPEVRTREIHVTLRTRLQSALVSRSVTTPPSLLLTPPSLLPIEVNPSF